MVWVPVRAMQPSSSAPAGWQSSAAVVVATPWMAPEPAVLAEQQQPEVAEGAVGRQQEQRHFAALAHGPPRPIQAAEAR